MNKIGLITYTPVMSAEEGEIEELQFEGRSSANFYQLQDKVGEGTFGYIYSK